MSELKLSKYLQKSVVNVPAGPRLRTLTVKASTLETKLHTLLTTMWSGGAKKVPKSKGV
jgi:hypothetical protein